jgi:AsmA-like C-terminal region
MVDLKQLPRPERLRIPGRVLVTAAMIALALGALEYLARNWPFTEAAVMQSLEAASSTKVEIGSFRGTYFPHPGCTARDVVFRHDPRSDIPPLIRIQQLTVRSTFLGMLRKHVSMVRADGMQIYIPSESHQKFNSSSHMVIDELIANRCSLKFGRAKNKQLEFSIHWGQLQNLGASGGMPFHVRLWGPEPPGEIEAAGSFGPWNRGNASKTPVSGHYTFQRADLSVFRGIAGILSSSGSFDGILEHIAVLGATDTREFTVTSSRHKAELDNRFNAVVNAINGDVSLPHVESQFRRTEIISSGSIAAQHARPGKVTTLDLYSKNGRIQDLFLLFITAARSPMSGITSWRAHVTLPPGRHPFLRKVQLVGEFGIDAGNFTRAQTQQNVNKLSAESRDQDDHDPATVLSGLKGHVELQEGSATFSDLSFSVPGAFAEMHGTYELISHKVDLHGTLKMDSSLSHTAHGPKVVILKLMDPFFKKKPKGSQVPVKITGTYENPSFGLDLHGQKQTTSAKRLQHLYQPPTK